MPAQPAAHAATQALADLLADAPPWLPAVRSWEVFQEPDGTFSLNGEIVPHGGASAGYLLQAAAEATGGHYEHPAGLERTRLTRADHQVTLYYLSPAAQRPAPPGCATCPEPLEQYVWIGTPPTAVCLACRDRMHAAFLAARVDTPTRDR
ncbi:hypothetical protein ACFY4B_27520 [Kitasatospora sp. NPDC001261]|uniref:hypothetical protein n=1 Tax=Kitasatospora sp. NPDC001261 TaxID=3364012 RepID=UPI0036B5DA92